jgi:lipopolysaccharide exporter
VARCLERRARESCPRLPLIIPLRKATLSLARKAAVGALWTITTSVGSRLLGLVATLIITRFVAPAEYGSVMAAWAIVQTTTVLASIAPGQYIVVFPKSGPQVTFHVTFYLVVLCFTALTITYLLRIPLANLVGAPDAAKYLPILIGAVAIDMFSFTTTRVLNRDLRFRTLSLGRTAGEVIYTAVGIGLAATGWGGMAVALANLCRAAGRSLVFVSSVKLSEWLVPHRIRWDTTKKLFKFGIPLWISNIALLGAHSWDNLLMSRIFGPAALGRYNFAYNLADIPATHIGEHIGDVLIPSFAQMPDIEHRKRALVRALGLMGLIVFPLAVGLGAVADTLVAALFDARWQAMAPMLAILSALSVTRPVGWVTSGYVLALGRTRTVGVLEVFKVALVLGLVSTIGRLGENWVCYAVGIAFGTYALASLYVVQRADKLPMTEMIRPLVRPLLSTLPLVVAVFGTRRLAFEVLSIPPWAALLLEVAAGALAYVGAALLIASKQSRDLLSILWGVLKRRRGGSDSEPPSAQASSGGEPPSAT